MITPANEPPNNRPLVRFLGGLLLSKYMKMSDLLRATAADDEACRRRCGVLIISPLLLLLLLFFPPYFYFNFFLSLSLHSRGHPLRPYSLAGLWVGLALALACVRPGFPPESIVVSSTCRYNTVPVGAGYIQEAKRNERPPRLADV